MKNKLLFALLLFAVSCKQEENKQSNPQPMSSWVIGKDSFATNQTTITYGKSIVVLWCDAKNSKFGYSNGAAAALPNGRNKLDVYNTNNPVYLDFGFSKGNVVYRPIDTSVYVESVHSNGIVTMEMPLAKFMNEIDSVDTQLIKATIRVREK